MVLGVLMMRGRVTQQVSSPTLMLMLSRRLVNRAKPIMRKLFILQESQEMREKQRLASAAKKEKDKQDRINQKSQAEERKKKAQEKSAKGERRSGR